MIDLKFFFNISRDVAMATNFVAKLPTPARIALSFRNGMGYRYLNESINSVNDAYILCQNFVKFGPVVFEIKWGRK